MKSDIEIADSVVLSNILDITEKAGIDEKYVECYGRHKAKIDLSYLSDNEDKEDGNLILVTAITPTPLGEGKTTTTIGLGDGLRRIGKNAVLALREPSMGPVFGVKGGATGGGMAQVAPMADINLHFNGDFHAIEAANNLLCAMVDTVRISWTEPPTNPSPQTCSQPNRSGHIPHPRSARRRMHHRDCRQPWLFLPAGIVPHRHRACI